MDDVRWLAGKMGTRLVFGNDGTWSDNVGALAELRRLRKAASIPSAPPWAELRAGNLRERGWTSLPAFADDVMGPIRAGYHRVIDDASRTHDMGARDRSVVRYVIDPLQQIPELRRLLDHRVQDCLVAYYRTHFRLLHLRMWRISALPEAEQTRDNYGNLWHCDRHRVTLLKVFVQISDDVSAHNGALRMFDVATTKSVMRRGYVSQSKQVSWAARRLRDERGVSYFDGPPGSAIAVNANRCLHRAGVPQPGRTRGMVQLTFDIADHAPAGRDYFAEMAPDVNVLEGRPV